MRLALVVLSTAPLVLVATAARADETSPVYVRLEAGGTANAATYERTDATEGGRLSSVRAHTFGSTVRAQIGYPIVPSFAVAAMLAIDYASISPSTRGNGYALATFGKFTQTTVAFEANWLPAGGLRLGGSLGYTTIAFPDENAASFVEDLDPTLSGPCWGLILGYDFRLSGFASIGVAARFDFAHVTNDRQDGHSSMNTFAPGLSVAITFR